MAASRASYRHNSLICCHFPAPSSCIRQQMQSKCPRYMPYHIECVENRWILFLVVEMASLAHHRAKALIQLFCSQQMPQTSKQGMYANRWFSVQSYRFSGIFCKTKDPFWGRWLLLSGHPVCWELGAFAEMAHFRLEPCSVVAAMASEDVHQRLGHKRTPQGWFRGSAGWC